MIPYATSIKYMIGGYAVIFVILAVYLTSLILRWRKLRHDLDLLAKLEK